MNFGQIIPSTRAVALGITNFLLVALCFTPALYMFGQSFFDAAGELSLASYRQLISIATESRGRELLLSSVALGAGAAGLSTLLAELKQWLKKLEITTVYVTHDYAEARYLAERIVKLKDGKVTDEFDE